jgi:hypothetical protein
VRHLGTLLVALMALPALARATDVTGIVTDRSGRPIEYASVAVPALKFGTAADDSGRFVLQLPPGPALVQVSQMGYEPARVQVVVAAGLAPLHITLREQPVELSEVTVRASSFGKAGKAEGPVLSRRDVLMTPGGAADVFQSLKALPGINAPADGAAVYVRGGPPEESVIRLDGSDIGHPYHYERASGGLFGSLDPYMVSSAFFSSGGFSAKYGGAISGVLDIAMQDPRDLRTATLGANLAGLSASGTAPIVRGRLSASGSLRLSVPELLFRLYGSSSDYETAPVSRDGTGRLLWRYSPTGKATLTWLAAGDEVSLRGRYLNVEARYADHMRTDFGALRFEDAIAGRVALHGQFSAQGYRSGWTFGPVDATQREQTVQGSLDAVCPLTPRHEISAGLLLRRRDTTIEGTFPADSVDLAPDAPTREVRTHPTLDAAGAYLEDKLRLVGPLYATVGGRLDRLSTPGIITVDPRAALAWRVDDRQTVRVASGRYHQPAEARYLDPVYGNPRLEPLEATHLIAGYEWKSEFGNVRLEGYRKDYRHLVRVDPVSWYASSGHGYASGVDAFVQGTHRWLSGWVSYGWLDTRRQELDDPRLVPGAYGMKHNLTLVALYQAASRLHLGAHYAYGSGQPYTPVVGRAWDPARGLWRPVFGENHSAMIPPYHRLDLRITRLFTPPHALGLRPSSICVAYIEGLNVLGIRNILEYEWNADFTQRIARESYFARRLLVAGFSLSW